MITAWKLRIKLARWLAPHGADVYDPDEEVSPLDAAVLSAVRDYDLQPDIRGRVALDVTDYVLEHSSACLWWIRETTDHEGCPLYMLTAAGQAQLDRVTRRLK